MNTKIYVMFDCDKCVVGHTLDEAIAIKYCETGNKKLYPYSYGMSYTYYESELITDMTLLE